MAGPYVIGVDGGTESLRAGVFDTAGRPLAFASSAYETHFPHPGWAEQDPAHWWRAVGAAVREAIANAGIAPDADSRGVISGLTLKHGRAHLFRAMMEGVAFGTELIFEAYKETYNALKATLHRQAAAGARSEC